MRGTVEVEQPDSVEVSVTLTASLKEFKELREQIGEKWPGWKVAEILNTAIRRIEATLDARESEESR